jgi:hypothetical protein
VTCAAQSFSDDASQDQQATLLFEAAAQFCADQVADPTLDFPHASSRTQPSDQSRTVRTQGVRMGESRRAAGRAG